jgi:hypothetical protein
LEPLQFSIGNDNVLGYEEPRQGDLDDSEEGAMKMPRVRFKILTLMLVVLVTAAAVSWLRPVTQYEAQRIAIERFLQVPGATRWAARFKAHAWFAGPRDDGAIWIVDFQEAKDGTHLAQMVVTSRGNIHALGLAPGKFK